MANRVYLQAVIALLRDNANLLTGTVRGVLVDGDYAPDTRNDQTLADVPAAARMATSQPFTGKTFADNTFDAADAEFGAIPDAGGDQSTAMVIYLDTGNEGTSTLLAIQDVVFRPNGGTFSVSFSTNPDHVFRIQGDI